MANKTVCNICGNDFDMWDKQESFGLHHHVGYGSAHDGEHIDLNMCCNCFDRLMDYILPQCTVSPITKEDDYGI